MAHCTFVAHAASEHALLLLAIADLKPVPDSLALSSRLFPNPRPISEPLELIGLESDAHTRIGHLSGGQRRRVDLALGIIGRPELLFLDEQTTGPARRESWAIVKRLAADGTTVLFSTHDMEEAQQLARRLLVLAGGQLVVDSRPEQVRARAAYTCRCRPRGT